MFARDQRRTNLDNGYYNPGPGEYQESVLREFLQKSKVEKTVLKPSAKSLKEKAQEVKDALGPGSYEYQQVKNTSNKLKVLKNKQSIKRELYVIKKAKQIDGSNDTQLILEKFQPQVEKFNLDHLGPGYYNPDMKHVKPKTQGVKINEENIEENYVQLNLKQTDDFNEQIRQMLYQNKEQKQINKSQGKSHQYSNQVMLKHKERINKEIKRQQHLNEDKRMLFSLIKFEQEDKLYENFKQNKQKQLANQQVQNKQRLERFHSQSASNLLENVGPGAYDIDKYQKFYEKGQMIAVDQGRRFNQRYIQDQSEKQIPGPGQYESQNLNKFQKKYQQQDESAFGSGTLRGVHQEIPNQQPGPGSYNINSQFKKKKKQKYYMLKVPQQQTNLPPKMDFILYKNDVDHDIDQNINLRSSYEIEKVVHNNAVFKSNQNRFPYDKDDNTFNFIDYENQFIKKTFSQQKNQFEKSPKKTWFDGKSGTQKLLGPGTYI